jgi:hypothetical protein
VLLFYFPIKYKIFGFVFLKHERKHYIFSIVTLTPNVEQLVIYFSILFAKQWICSFQNQWRVLVVWSFCLLCCPNISLSHCLNVSLPLFQCPSVIWSHCLNCPTASLAVASLSIVQYFQWVSFDSKRKGVKVRLCPPSSPAHHLSHWFRPCLVSVLWRAFRSYSLCLFLLSALSIYLLSLSTPPPPPLVTEPVLSRRAPGAAASRLTDTAGESVGGGRRKLVGCVSRPGPTAMPAAGPVVPVRGGGGGGGII